GVLLDMVLLEIPALREGPPHGGRSKWRLPEFLCLSVPTLTAPERVIQLPDPRTVDDPIAAMLDRTAVTGVNDLPIIALISSLLSTATPRWGDLLPGAVTDDHRQTECFGDDLLSGSVAAARQVCRKGATPTLFEKGAALEADDHCHPREYLRGILRLDDPSPGSHLRSANIRHRLHLVSACRTEPVCELGGSLTASAVAETIITIGACHDRPGRPVLFDLDSMSITRTLAALMHDVMLRQTLLSPYSKSFIPCCCTIWGWISSDTLDRCSADTQALMSYFDFVLELDLGCCPGDEQRRRDGTWRSVRSKESVLTPAAEGQLQSHAEELSCIDVNRLIWLATAVATIRQSHLQEVQVDRADVSKAYEVRGNNRFAETV
ncbi:hypothetical protein FOZ63_030529, partial [Perkinsus olseni]